MTNTIFNRKAADEPDLWFPDPEQETHRMGTVFSDEKLNAAKALLGDLYAGQDEEAFTLWRNDYSNVPDALLDEARTKLFHRSPEQWAVVELAKPSRNTGDVQEKLVALEQIEKKELADVVRNRGKAEETPFLKPDPTPDEALAYLKNTYNPATGLKGPPGTKANKQHRDWVKALDAIKKSIPHAYQFVFNILNAPGHPPQDWQTAEDFLKTDKQLWPYYVWMIPGVRERYPDVPRPKDAKQVAEERPKYNAQKLADEVERGDKTVQENYDKAERVKAAVKSAASGRGREHALEQEKIIAEDPETAMFYYLNYLAPFETRSPELEKVITANKSSYAKEDWDAFDKTVNPEEKKPKTISTEMASIPPMEAAQQAIEYSAAGKDFPELEEAIAKDFNAISLYVDQVLVPKNKQSEKIMSALKVGLGTNRDMALGIYAKFGKDVFVKALTDTVKDLAGSDPAAAVECYDKWRGTGTSPELDQIALAARAKVGRAPSEDLSKIQIATKLEKIWRKI